MRDTGSSTPTAMCSSRLVGHLARVAPFIEGGGSAEGAAGAGARAAEAMAAGAAAPAALRALAAPDEGRGRGVPAERGGLQPGDDLVGGGRVLPVQGAADEDALDRLGHVEPGPPER